MLEMIDKLPARERPIDDFGGNVEFRVHLTSKEFENVAILDGWRITRKDDAGDRRRIPGWNENR